MRFVNGKPVFIDYKKEQKDADNLREALRVISNHLVKPNAEIAVILTRLANHKYYYIYEAMEQNASIKAVMKKYKLTESQYDKYKKEFFLLFYQLYQLEEGDNIEIR